MKKTNLTISYEEEKLKALRWYLGQKNTKLEDELSKAVDTLFQKNVPANVRSYITKAPDSAMVSDTPRLHRPEPTGQAEASAPVRPLPPR